MPDWTRARVCSYGGDCVSAELLPDGGVHVRDTKLGDASPVLAFDRDEWLSFVEGVRAGEFDVPDATDGGEAR